MTAYLDLGDKYSYPCLIDQESGEVREEGRLRTPQGPQTTLRLRAAQAHRHRGWHPLSVGKQGTGGVWLRGLGGQCQEAEAHLCQQANDRRDRRLKNLARLARVDPKLLYPLKHRDEESQAHMALIRSRQALIGWRTQLVNHVRGAVKSFGGRLPQCPAVSFHNKAAEHIPEALWPALEPVLEQIASLTQSASANTTESLRPSPRRAIQKPSSCARSRWLERLRRSRSCSPWRTPYRFERSRSVGAYLGLVPATAQSGDRDPQKSISKEGDEMLRKLLVSSAYYILGPFGSDSDLRRHGEKVASRGGKNSKKRAVVALARKLAVLLHSMWIIAEVYEPLRNTHRSSGGQAA